MNSSVIIFPGSNCDRDMAVALKKIGFKNKMVWHDDTELPKSDLVVLPGTLLKNKFSEFICKNVFVKINNTKNNYFKKIKKNTLELHIAHNEGNYFCSNNQIKEIEDSDQIALFYCGENGEINEKFNPNGSIKNIAGIFNKEKNIMGMMPHPERMIDKYLSGDDGAIFFETLLNNLK